MATDALSSHGTILSFQATPGGAFIEVAELGDITPPGLMRNEFDASIHNKDIDQWIMGILRREPITVPVFFNRALPSHSGLRQLLIANDETGFKLENPDGDEWIGSGFVRGLQGASPVDGIQTATLTVRLSGNFILNGVQIGDL
jgi:hypothetical protein